jgi:hypothetical protein
MPIFHIKQDVFDEILALNTIFLWFLEVFYGLVLRLQSQTLIFVVTKVPTPNKTKLIEKLYIYFYLPFSNSREITSF